jgi:hypothetical protein
LLLPLLAGGGWEGVKLLIFFAKSDPTPALPCEQGRGFLRDGVEPPAEGSPHALCPTRLDALVKNALCASHLEILNRLLVPWSDQCPRMDWYAVSAV